MQVLAIPGVTGRGLFRHIDIQWSMQHCLHTMHCNTEDCGRSHLQDRGTQEAQELYSCMRVHLSE
jgi:hypothetical protein